VGTTGPTLPEVALLDAAPAPLLATVVGLVGPSPSCAARFALQLIINIKTSISPRDVLIMSESLSHLDLR